MGVDAYGVDEADVDLLRDVYGIDEAMARRDVPDVGLLRECGKVVSKPHLDHMYREVDEMGSDEWYGEVPCGPDGEPLRREAALSDEERRRRVAMSILEGPVREGGLEDEIETLGGGGAPPDGRGQHGTSDTAALMATTGGTVSDGGFVMLPDSGCGATYLSPAVGGVWDGDRSKVVRFEDAQGGIVEARGGGEFNIGLYDHVAKVWRKESYGPGWCVPLESKSRTTLGSVHGAQARKLGTHYPWSGGAYHENEHGHVYRMMRPGEAGGAEGNGGGVAQIRAYLLSSTSTLRSGDVVDVTGLPELVIAVPKAQEAAAQGAYVTVRMNGDGGGDAGKAARSRDRTGTGAGFWDMMCWGNRVLAERGRAEAGFWDMMCRGNRVLAGRGRAEAKRREEVVRWLLTDECARAEFIRDVTEALYPLLLPAMAEVLGLADEVVPAAAVTRAQRKAAEVEAVRTKGLAAEAGEAARRAAEEAGAEKLRVQARHERERVKEERARELERKKAERKRDEATLKQAKGQRRRELEQERAEKAAELSRQRALEKEAREKRREEQLRFMKSKHIIVHEGATRLNARLGEFGEQGRRVTPEELNCDSCMLANMDKEDRSSEARPVPGKVLSEFQLDFWIAPKEYWNNRDGFKVILGFVCRACGWRLLYCAKDRSQATVISALRALEREVKRLGPYVLAKHGYEPEISLFECDGDGGFTTTYGATKSAVDTEVLAKNIARNFAIDTPHRHGKIEALWKVMSRAVASGLAESGMRGAHAFDAVSHFEFVTNHMGTGTSNAIAPGEAPMFTIGGDALLSPRRAAWAELPFGMPVWVYCGNELSLEGDYLPAEAKGPRFGVRAVLIGMGKDTAGLRCISLVQKKIVTTLNVYAPRGGLYGPRDFITSLRESPFTSGAAGAWVFSVYEREPKARIAGKARTGPEGEIVDLLDEEGRPALLRADGDGWVASSDGAYDVDPVGAVGAAGAPGDAAGAVGAVGAVAPGDAASAVGAEGAVGAARSVGGEEEEKKEEEELRGDGLSRKQDGRKQRKQLARREKRLRNAGCRDPACQEDHQGQRGLRSSAGLDARADWFTPQNAFAEGGSVTIGTSAGGDSREQLRDAGEAAPVGAGSRRTKKFADGTGDRKFGTVMTRAEARELVQRARKERLGVAFDPNHSKGGRKQDRNMSAERYEVYKDLHTMEEIEEAERLPFTYSWGAKDTVMRRGKNQFGKVGDDLLFDVERGIALIQAGAATVGGVSAAAAFQMAPYRRAVKSLMAAGVVQMDEAFYGEAVGWYEANGSGHGQVPTWFAMAAKARTQVVVDGMVEPMSIKQATMLPEWPQWKAAIEKEIKGLLENDTWEEVDRSEAVGKGKRVLPARMILTIKTKEVEGVMVMDKLKGRFVYGGHRSVYGRDHFETAAWTASPKTIRTLLALAARSGHEVVSYDISQAYLLSRVEAGEEYYMELPELMGEGGVEAPGEYSGCGSGRGSGKVAKLGKYVYGMPVAGRKWMQNVQRCMAKMGARSLVSDRMAFRWKLKINGKVETMSVAVHVDDFVCVCSCDEIKHEFARRLAAEWGEGRVTGGEPVDYVLGMKVERDLEKKTVTISQGGFVRQLLESFGVEETPGRKMSPLSGGVHLQKNEGPAVPREEFDYMRFLGSVQWLVCSTRPDLAHACGMLARYGNNPSMEHVEEARHVLKYLACTADLGITYHGSDAVLMAGGYDRRDKLVASVDSDLGGCPDTHRSTSGIVIMLNGGAVSWRSTKQSTNSTSTLEAEMKAAALCVMEIAWLRDVLDEHVREGFPGVAPMHDVRGFDVVGGFEVLGKRRDKRLGVRVRLPKPHLAEFGSVPSVTSGSVQSRVRRCKSQVLASSGRVLGIQEQRDFGLRDELPV